MADIRSAQVIAQVEYQDPPLIKSSQLVVQVEWVPTPFGEYNGSITLELIPEAGHSGHYVYDGDVTVSLIPESEAGFGNFYYGDTTLSLIPESDVLLAFLYIGDVSVTLIPEADIIGDYGYEGIIPLELYPKSAYAIPRPGFDWWFGYGFVDLSFLAGNPPYYCATGDIEASFSFDTTVLPYRRHTVVASGGVKVGGTGVFAFEKPLVFTVIGRGGFLFKGDGVEVFSAPTIYTVIAEGGSEISGVGEFVFVDAPEDFEYAVVGSGGYELRGRGEIVFISAIPVYTLVGFGGYKFSGTGTSVFTDPEVIEYVIVGSGGYKLSGEGDSIYVVPDKVFSLIATGEIALSGVGRFAWLEPDYFRVIGFGGLVVSGEGTEEEFVHYTWVFSGIDYKPSIYSGYNFNSYCTFGGKVYGANEEGIFELSGNTDDGMDIHTGLILGPHNLGIVNRKRLRTVRLGEKNKAARVRVELDATSKDFSVINRKVDITRDLVGEELTLTLADFEEISVIELMPVVLESRG